MAEGPNDASTKLREPAPPNTISTTRRFSLEIIEGAEKGQSLILDESRASRALIGKSPACELRLSDPLVSRRHVAVDVSGDELHLLDLGSTNGTSVNDLNLREAFLRGGEIVRIGDTQIRVTAGERATDVALSSATAFGRLIGASIAMRRLYPLCERLAATDISVLIEGETGTGKEVLAEALHEASARADGPFVVFDCTTVPPTLLESELFGHERGAFTGATASRKGLFEQAHGGTLLIDEIGDLDLALQPRLLRAIQQSEIRRVGGDKWLHVDVRIIAATRRNLDQEVQGGRFRDDLFYRLAVARIELPPLRERGGDVALLARHFWKTLGGSGALPYDLQRRFEEYAWPGNVRELHHEIARRVSLGDLADPKRSLVSELPPTAGRLPGTDASSPDFTGTDFIDRVVAGELSFPRAREQVNAEFLKRYVEHALARHGGNISAAARGSGVALRYFQLLRARQAAKK